MNVALIKVLAMLHNHIAAAHHVKVVENPRIETSDDQILVPIFNILKMCIIKHKSSD